MNKKIEKFCPEHLGPNFSKKFFHILDYATTSYFHFEIYWPLSRSMRVFSAKIKIYHTVSLMISGILSSCFGSNNWLIVKPDRIHISSTFWWPLISTKDLRTLLRNLGTCSPSRCFTDSSKNFIGSDFSDANTGAAKKKDRRLVQF